MSFSCERNALHQLAPAYNIVNATIYTLGAYRVLWVAIH